MSDDEAVLFQTSVSFVAPVVAVPVMTVPATVPAATLNTGVKLADAPHALEQRAFRAFALADRPGVRVAVSGGPSEQLLEMLVDRRLDLVA